MIYYQPNISYLDDLQRVMKNKILLILLCFVFITCGVTPGAHAYWVWSPESGKFVNPEGAVQDTAEEQYDYAMRLYKEKDLDEAAEQLKGLLKKYPGARIAAEAQYRLGTIYEEQSDYMKAFKAYRTLVESYPQTERLSEVIEREFRIGNLFLSGRKGKLMGIEILPSLPRAVEVFKHIVTQAPYSEWGDDAQFRLGVAYKKWSHFDEAVEAFQGFIDQYPKSELLPEARFQLAETSYLRSSSAYRDQRALDDASQQVDRFLGQYPDTTASEKAAKLRQMIDEKNAEKNYRVGLYYEKENFLPSALIYYSDVAKNYAHTQWGQKSAEKLKSLREPVSFHSTEVKQIEDDVSILRAKIAAMTDDEKAEKEKLKRQMERLEEKHESIAKTRKDSMKRRDMDIKRREREWKDKVKKLKIKRKLLKKNPSEDLKRAFDRWEASLETERQELEKEKVQNVEIKKVMGMDSGGLSWEVLPFVGPPRSEVDKVRRIEAKQLYKISEDKKILLDEKEVLYRQYSEIAHLLQNMENERLGIYSEEQTYEAIQAKGGEKLENRRQELEGIRSQIKGLEDDLKEKQKIYEDRYGKSLVTGLFKSSTRIAAQSADAVGQSIQQSINWLNPFDGKASALEDKTLDELLERQMHLKEKINSQKTMVETLGQAFDEELALQEQKRLLDSLQVEEEINVSEFRRAIKKVEKDIRRGYQEIGDRNKLKNDLLKELDGVLKANEASRPVWVRAGKAVAAPAVGFGKFWKAFIFGLPNQDAVLTEEAQHVNASSVNMERVQELKDEIELQSVLIEAKSREIENLRKEREIMRAKASLAGGLKFRSAFVDIPYEVIGEAIENARKLVPKKERGEIIIQKLNKETSQLEAYKSEMRMIDEAIKNKEGGRQRSASESAPAVSKEESSESAMSEAVPESSQETDPGQEAIKAEVEIMIQKIETERQNYEKERISFETELRQFMKESNSYLETSHDASADLSEEEIDLRGELSQLGGEIENMIEREKSLQEKETGILEKRIQKIDVIIQKVNSQAASQDLLTERGRLEGRLDQLQSRSDFLSNEVQRFQLPETSRSGR